MLRLELWMKGKGPLPESFVDVAIMKGAEIVLNGHDYVQLEARFRHLLVMWNETANTVKTEAMNG